MVASAAAAISLATWIAVPGGFIFFGILHQIALASVLGLAFLRLPAALTLLVAAAVVAAPHFLRSSIFDHPALWWVGLSTQNPRSNDYVPLFPWFGAVLFGMTAARLSDAAGLFRHMAAYSPGIWSKPLQMAGRHSLAVYLVHQPLLIGALWLFSQVAPPTVAGRDIQFTNACIAQCQETHGGEFCQTYCVCVVDTLESEGSFDEVYGGTPAPETAARLQEIVSACSLDAELLDAPPEGEQ